RLAGDGMDIGHVLVAGQRVADEHEVRLIRVQRAIGLISDGERHKLLAAVERQRIVEMDDLALRIGDLRKSNGMVQKRLRYRRFTHHSKSMAPFVSEDIMPANLTIRR